MRFLKIKQMKTRILFGLLFFVASPFAFAQTQQEIDKMMKQAQEMMNKYVKDSNVKNNSSFTSASYEHLKLPPKKQQLLNLIPKKSLSQADIKTMATTLLAQLRKFCDKKSVANIDKLIHSSSAGDLSQLAVLLWYKNAMEEAVMLSVYAVSQLPEDLALNNCGAILNLSGLATYSVSFLKYALQNNPDNSTLLNNIGQAYFSLGETDSATYYLQRCIKRSPLNPEGNKTEGVIETGKGDKEKAKKTIADAMKGGFTDEAKRIVRFLDPPVHYSHYLKPRVKVPEYFTPYKFELPVICRNREDVPRALAEVDAYQRAIDVPLKQYSAIMTENFKIQADNFSNKLERQQSPFFHTGTSILGDLEKEFTSKLGEVDKRYKQLGKDVSALIMKHEIEFQQLNKDFDERQREYGKTHEGIDPAIEKERCTALNNLFNNYQLEYIALAENIQHQFFQVWADHINDISFWLYLGTSSKTQFKELFAHYTATYLARLKGLAQNSLPVFRYCDKDKWTKQDKEMKVKEPECPVNVEIFLGVGKIDIDCDVFAIELEFGKGMDLEFNYEKNFRTGTSTIAFGAGFSLGIPEVEFTTSAGQAIPASPVQLGAKQQFYITFDRDNSVSDLGVLWEAEADLRGMNKPDGKATMKLGMLSGTLEIDEGPLKPVADKIFGIQPEQQQNKKVEIYKPKQG